MRRPGQRRREDHVDDRVGRDRSHQKAQAWRVLVWRDQGQQLLQREEHQPETDRHPADVTRARSKAAAEQDDADQHEQRRDPADVEGQQLHDQGRADIGAQHDRQGRNQIDHAAGSKARRHQPGCGTALQDSGDPETGKKGSDAVSEGAAQKPPQLRTEGSLNAALHHVHAPEQEGDPASEIDQGQGRFQHALLCPEFGRGHSPPINARVK
jgi:hypothetical protein